MAELLEEILNSAAPLNPCGDECDHTEAEHYAFDSGVAAGERGDDEESCPYPDGELREAWLIGRSVNYSPEVA